jgi:phenylalanyl-tRNA synthetase alpha chain
VSEPTAITDQTTAAAVDDALAAFAAASTSTELKAARSAHTGEASPLARLNASLRTVPNDQKAALGKLVGQARGRVNQALAAREGEVLIAG